MEGLEFKLEPHPQLSGQSFFKASWYRQQKPDQMGYKARSIKLFKVDEGKKHNET